ncbi:pleckstrin homology domain-containing family G member 1-like [Electrophorus electricus]|uniref:pleckstrin homology domain-containing family G member 1-like n=1 Tax=Electrophorus electricus TaxID=8005 RepID=UPI0015CFDD4C|nr:pleckstrin homology domain-containing family G member 1-like [Electrophorus electricus]
MDSSHCSERPISYGSTGSSASSRDRHCSLGGRAVSTPERDQDSGAIRLELVPARQLEEAETGRRTPAPTNQEDADGGHPGEGRKVPYVDRVVQEILETEKTYVQDLQSIVQLFGVTGQELATLLQKESERHTVVQEAIDTMQRVAWHINDMKRKYENTVRLQRLWCEVAMPVLPDSHSKPQFATPTSCPMRALCCVGNVELRTSG